MLVLSNILMTYNLLNVYICREKTYQAAVIQYVLHAISGALYQSVIYDCLSKHLLVKKYREIGISFFFLMNGLMNFICPFINGWIIGETMKKRNSLDVILF